MFVKGILGSVVFFAGVAAATAAPPTLQDLDVISRAISFLERERRPIVNLAVVFDSSQPSSLEEARGAMRLLGSGLRTGNVELRAIEIDVRSPGRAASYDAVLSMAGVDQRLLSAFLQSSGTPCFTLHAAQVGQGACTVAVRTSPTVSISMNSQNAAAAGVRFATAFIMMVREL